MSPSGRRAALRRAPAARTAAGSWSARRMASPREQLAARQAVVVEDPAKQAGEIAALGSRVPGKQSIDQRLDRHLPSHRADPPARVRRMASSRRAAVWPDRGDRRSRAAGRVPAALRRCRRGPLARPEHERGCHARRARRRPSRDSLRVRVRTKISRALVTSPGPEGRRSRRRWRAPVVTARRASVVSARRRPDAQQCQRPQLVDGLALLAAVGDRVAVVDPGREEGLRRGLIEDRVVRVDDRRGGAEVALEMMTPPRAVTAALAPSYVLTSAPRKP